MVERNKSELDSVTLLSGLLKDVLCSSIQSEYAQSMIKLYSFFFNVNKPVDRFVFLRNSNAEQELKEFEELNRARITASSYIDCCRWIVESFEESELNEADESKDLNRKMRTGKLCRTNYT